MTDRQTVSTADYAKLKRENEELKIEVERLEEKIKDLNATIYYACKAK